MTEWVSSSIWSADLTEAAHPWSRPAEQVAAVAERGQNHPEQGYVPEGSTHSLFRIWLRRIVRIIAPSHHAYKSRTCKWNRTYLSYLQWSTHVRTPLCLWSIQLQVHWQDAVIVTHTYTNKGNTLRYNKNTFLPKSLHITILPVKQYSNFVLWLLNILYVTSYFESSMLAL